MTETVSGRSPAETAAAAAGAETDAMSRPSDLVRDDLSGSGSEQPGPGTSTVSEDDILEAMKDVVDPELGINVVDLGLIYGVHVEEDHSITIDMTLTTPACPLTDVLEDQTATALEGLATKATINWVWMPPWGLERITDDGREQLRTLGFNI